VNISYYLYYLDQKLQLFKGLKYTIGRGREHDVILPHSSVSRNHAQIVWMDGEFLLEDIGSTNGAFLNDHKIQSQAMMDGDKIRIGKFNLQFRIHEGEGGAEAPSTLPRSETLQMEQKLGLILQEIEDNPEIAEMIFDLKSLYELKTGRLTTLAFRDPLTQLYNRRFFDERLEDEISRAFRYKRPMTLIMVDIDHFKRCNDTYGHQKGDEVLQVVAQVLENNTRNQDYACRYGGEEMAIILPETDQAAAMLVAEKLRLKVSEFVEKETGIAITISLGVATLQDGQDAPAILIGQADAALYRSKSMGRNRVTAATSENQNA